MKEQRAALQQLLKSPGWALVSAVVNTWIAAQQQRILAQPITGAEDAYARNLDIGMTRGHLSVIGLPEEQIKNLTAAIDAERARDDRENSSEGDEA